MCRRSTKYTSFIHENKAIAIEAIPLLFQDDIKVSSKTFQIYVLVPAFITVKSLHILSYGFYACLFFMRQRHTSHALVTLKVCFTVSCLHTDQIISEACVTTL